MILGEVDLNLEKKLDSLLEEVEIILDSLNGRFGDERELCLYCHSNKWSSYGIIHTDKCIITRLRKENGTIRKAREKAGLKEEQNEETRQESRNNLQECSR